MSPGVYGIHLKIVLIFMNFVPIYTAVRLPLEQQEQQAAGKLHPFRSKWSGWGLPTILAR